MSTLHHQGSFQSKRISVADHTIGSDIGHLLQKVNLNSAFLNLAKNDADMVQEMKQAIIALWEDARRREVLYIAIEHNVKYLTAIAQASDHAKDLALSEYEKLKVEFMQQKVDFDKMQRQNKVLQKDSDQLNIERQRVNQLTLDLTKAKEKEEQNAGQLKEAQKKLKKIEKELKELQSEHDDKIKKLQWTEEQYSSLQKDHKNLTLKDQQLQDDNENMKQAHERYRQAIVKNEAVLTKQTAELVELKKLTETSKN